MSAISTICNCIIPECGLRRTQVWNVLHGHGDEYSMDAMYHKDIYAMHDMEVKVEEDHEFAWTWMVPPPIRQKYKVDEVEDYNKRMAKLADSRKYKFKLNRSSQWERYTGRYHGANGKSALASAEGEVLKQYSDIDLDTIGLEPSSEPWGRGCTYDHRVASAVRKQLKTAAKPVCHETRGDEESQPLIPCSERKEAHVLPYIMKDREWWKGVVKCGFWDDRASKWVICSLCMEVGDGYFANTCETCGNSLGAPYAVMAAGYATYVSEMCKSMWTWS